MKTTKLLVFSILFILWGSTSNLYAQPGYGNRMAYDQSMSQGVLPCTQWLSNLTEDQKVAIQDLEKQHQDSMATLRLQRRSTFDPIEKNTIRGQMLKKVESHRNAVKKLLTEDQQKEYDLLHARYGYGRGQGFARGRWGGGRQAGFRGRGRGYCPRMGAGYNGGWRGNRGRGFYGY